MLIVLEATSCPKGSKEGGQQSHQDQGDHSASPTTGLLCNSGTIQQTQNPQIGEFSENLPKSGGEGIKIVVRVGWKEHKAKKISQANWANWAFNGNSNLCIIWF